MLQCRLPKPLLGLGAHRVGAGHHGWPRHAQL